MQWHRFLTVARKASVAAVGVVAMGVSNGFFHDPWDKVAVAVLAVATYFGVYATENTKVTR
jgi:uncharacterized protein with NRDE domain